jgi:hypothetical protein
MTTMSGSSSHPPSITAQRITSQQSYAASPDASMVQHHGRPPPPHPAPPSSPTTGQMRPSSPPQPMPPNFAHFGPPQQQQRTPQANPGTTAMTFHPHSHPPPLATSTNQFTTIPPHVTFQHPTTTSYAPGGSTGQQHHAIPTGYFPSSHPYAAAQHTVNPPPMQQQQQGSVGYPSPGSNFSAHAVHGSPASSTGSSYQSSVGSSPFPPYRPAAVYNQQQPQPPMMSTTSGKRGREGERRRVRERVRKRERKTLQTLPYITNITYITLHYRNIALHYR